MSSDPTKPHFTGHLFGIIAQAVTQGEEALLTFIMGIM